MGKIITYDEFYDLDKKPLGKIVCTSGGFDPIHPGHISCLQESKKLGDTLVVIVNGNWFLQQKKGRALMPLEDRCLVVSAIEGVDYVIPYETDKETSVVIPLLYIRPHIFTKGGDRSSPDLVPEYNTCRAMSTEVLFGIGEAKKWASSNYLSEWIGIDKNDVESMELAIRQYKHMAEENGAVKDFYVYDSSIHSFFSTLKMITQ